MGNKKARSGEPEGLPDLTDTTLTRRQTACQAGKARSERRISAAPRSNACSSGRGRPYAWPRGRILRARRAPRAGPRRATSRAPSRSRSRRRSRRPSTSGEHLLAEAGTGTGKSLAYLDSRSRVGPARGRLDCDEGAPGAAADEGRSGRRRRARAGGEGRRAQGAPELPLPERPARLRAPRRRALLARGRRGGVRGDARLDRDDRDRRPGRARGRAAGRRLVGDRGRRRPLPRPPLRVRRLVLLGGGARARLARRARDREPRALLRRPRPAEPDRFAGRPARARRGRLRRGAPARGVRRHLARRTDQRPGAAPAAPGRRPRVPRGGASRSGARARPRRGRRAAAARGRRARLGQAPAARGAGGAGAARSARGSPSSPRR